MINIKKRKERSQTKRSKMHPTNHMPLESSHGSCILLRGWALWHPPRILKWQLARSEHVSPSQEHLGQHPLRITISVCTLGLEMIRPMIWKGKKLVTAGLKVVINTLRPRSLSWRNSGKQNYSLTSVWNTSTWMKCTVTTCDDEKSQSAVSDIVKLR